MNQDPNDVGDRDSVLSDELQRFAADLARLRPRDDRLDRERLAFLAGQASVARASDRQAVLLGLPLESRAWPAAFASMTAVAAALLFALFTRSENPGIQRRAGDDVAYSATPQQSIDPRNGRDVLSTRDAHLADIEARLASRESGRAGAESSPTFLDVRNVPVLTPAAWQQVINEIEPAQPSPRDATGQSRNRGVKS